MPERAKRWGGTRRLQLSLRTVAATAAVGMSLLLTGCFAGSGPEPAAPASATTTPPRLETATPAPAPTFKPDLAASENQEYFDSLVAGVLAAEPDAGGRAFIDALVVGGFDKAQMEVTFDRTAIDLEADSIQFSARLHGECLIGQFGPGSDSYHSIVAPVLGTGTCLIGATRQIDW